MNKKMYSRGSAMSFPLRMTEISDDIYYNENLYLYPSQTLKIQTMVQDACDKMEHDGSLMYDEFPDKIMVQKMAENIADKCNCDNKNEWFYYLTQMMLCGEMDFRRRRRKEHKKKFI